MFRLAEGQADLPLTDALGPGIHQIEFLRQTETWLGVMTVEGFTLAPGAKLVTPTPWPERRLLFIGDSVTSGEAAGRDAACPKDKAATWNAAGSFGMLLGHALSAQVHLVSFGGRGLVRDWQGKTDQLNAPQFFELSVPEGQPKSRPDLAWGHQAYIPDAVFISLGTNDFNLALGDFPSEKDFIDTYVSFISRIKKLYPNAKLFLTEGAIVNDASGRPQKTTLRNCLEKTVAKINDPTVRVLPSNHYPGDHCDAHPTSSQHEQMAKDLEPHLRKALGW
jgi:lysophospholipase L1-like esterase